MIRNLIIIIGTVSMIASCNSKEENVQANLSRTVKYVTSAPVEEKEFALPVYAFGKLAAAEESKLSFKVSGIIQNLYVNEGQQIRKGQVLATLDKKEIDAQVAGAKASFEKWQRDVKRMEKLYKEKVVTLESYQNVKTQYDVAVSNLQIAEFNQKYSTITAPFDGKVLGKYAEVNELTQAGSPIFLIGTSGSRMVIKVALTDKEVVNLLEGDSAIIQFDALPDLDFHGQVQMISNASDATSGLYETEIILRHYHHGLRNGFFAKVEIFPSQRSTYRFVPIEALVEGNKKKGYIYAIEDNVAVKVAVDIHSIMGHQLIVRNGTSVTSEVVIEGAQYLDHNDKIVIVNN